MTASIVALVVLLLIHLAGAYVLRQVVESRLHPEAAHGTRMAEVHLNLFSGRVDLREFHFSRNGKERFSAGRVHLRVAPWRLLTGHVQIRELELERVSVYLEQGPDGEWITGLPASPDTGPSDVPDDAGIAPVSIDELIVDDATILLVKGDHRTRLHIAAAGLQGLDTTDPGRAVPVHWKGSLDAAALRGEAQLVADPDAPSVAGTVTLDGLDWGSLGPWLEQVPLRAARLDFDGRFDAGTRAAGLAGRLDLRGLSVADGTTRLTLDRLAANGLEARADLASGAASAVLPADMRIEGLDARHGAMHLTLRTASPRGRVAYTGQGVATGEELKLGIAGLALDDPGDGAEPGTAENGALAVELAGLEFAAASLEFRPQPGSLRFAGLALDLQALKTRAQGRSLASDSLSLAGGGELGGDGLPVRLADARMAFAGLLVADPGQDVSATLQRLAIADLQWKPAADGGPATISADLAAGDIQARAQGYDLGLTALDSTLQVDDPLATTRALRLVPRVRGVNVSGPGLPGEALQLQSASLASLRHAAGVTSLETLQLTGLDVRGGDAKAGLDIARVQAERVELAADGGLRLGQVDLNGLQLAVHRDKQGKWVQPLAPAVPAPAGGQDARAPFALAGLTVSGDSAITVADALAADGPRKVRIETLELGSLDAAEPGRDTPLKVRLAPDEFASIVFEGQLRPLGKHPWVKGEGEINGFSLPSVNPLVANDLGHRFLDGHIDDEFTISLADNLLEMQNKLRLHKLQAEPIAGKSGPPIGTAIMLLEDSEGQIDLDMPVSGNLDDPKFSVSAAIGPIIMKAIAGAAALAIQPAGSVLLVGTLLADQALKVRFAPVVFAPGSSEVDAAGRKLLGELAESLKSRPRIRLRLCGQAVESERQRDKQGKPVDTPEDLLRLARQRGAAVAAVLQELGVGAKRLRECRPRFDAGAGAEPRVDITL